MKTPYDAALRVRQRELDEVSSAIRAEAGALGAVEQQRARVAAALVREADLAAADITLVSPGWQQRMRGERQALSAREAQMQARLNALRDVAVDAYGVLRGIENAADDYRAEALRSAAAAEQSATDDISAAAFLRTLRAR
ncbi:hypothetical protein [Novosphingobium guangzhouense]|uniref:Flagellar export protein FliJ n=1 Tax=Novosphingobium guangzhouense TaxID=1850347 RepID=A0A2K2FVB4_9SPHN|nr:hypothetical protein [Novosphingobium guangzhouense]PNU02722.1 hypothetical protein A8V01_25760 [Novosphingobium guangzhouense]